MHQGHPAWELPSPATRRRQRRWGTSVATKAEIDGQEHYGTISDISPCGATVRFVSPHPVEVGSAVNLLLGEHGRVPGTLRWVNHEVLGVEFEPTASQHAGLADWLVVADLPRRRPRRAVQVEATALVADGELPCVVTEISDTGARARFAQPERATVGRDLVLLLPDQGPVNATVRHQTDGSTGLAFLQLPRQRDAA